MNLMISLGQFEIVPEELPDGCCLLTVTRIEEFDANGEGDGPNITIDIATLFDSRVCSGRIDEETNPLGG